MLVGFSAGYLQIKRESSRMMSGPRIAWITCRIWGCLVRPMTQGYWRWTLWRLYWVYSSPVNAYRNQTYLPVLNVFLWGKMHQNEQNIKIKNTTCTEIWINCMSLNLFLTRIPHILCILRTKFILQLRKGLLGLPQLHVAQHRQWWEETLLVVDLLEFSRGRSHLYSIVSLLVPWAVSFIDL